MSDMFVESLRNRIGAINTLYERCVSDMTLEQVNHQERAGMLPIAFSLATTSERRTSPSAAPSFSSRPSGSPAAGPRRSA